MSALARIGRMLLAGIDRLSRSLGMVSGCLILLMTLAMSYEVVMRYVFNAPTRWSTEIVGYLLLIAIFLAAADTMLAERHIRVDLLLVRLSGRKQAFLLILGSLLSLVFVAVLAWQGWKITSSAYRLNWRSDSALALPLFPTMIFIPIGSFLLILQLVSRICRYAASLGGKGALEVGKSAGEPSP